MVKKRLSVSESVPKCARLVSVLRGRRTLLIVMQDFPDPDAIAAAAALRELARSLGDVTTTLACGGFVGRAENQALLKYLGLNMQSLVNTDPESFECVAMVDTQPGAGNNALQTTIIPHIVVDHHPIRPLTRKAAFFDIRKQYGATSTICYEYLHCAGVPVPVPLATALLYGIRSDTADFGREATQKDIKAFLALYPLCNKRMLGRIAMARVPRAYFQTIATGLKNAQSAGVCVLTDLGTVANPDIVAEIADLLLRDEETIWSLCVGRYDGELLISVRTSDVSADAGVLMGKLVGREGTGGGHAAMAGGQIPLKTDDSAAVQKMSDNVISRFLTNLGEKKEDLRPLIES